MQQLKRMQMRKLSQLILQASSPAKRLKDTLEEDHAIFEFKTFLFLYSLLTLEGIANAHTHINCNSYIYPNKYFREGIFSWRKWGSLSEAI